MQAHNPQLLRSLVTLYTKGMVRPAFLKQVQLVLDDWNENEMEGIHISRVIHIEERDIFKGVEEDLKKCTKHVGPATVSLYNDYA